jgi:shikimate kinase
MIIFLVGFMGSGKSTLGRRLARKIDYPFTDMDEDIENEEQKTISDIFREKGEDYFRKLENAYLQKINNDKNLVIATGGGAPCFFNNMEVMNKKGVTIYLKMSPASLAFRLREAREHRPLLNEVSDQQLNDYVEQKLSKRENFYMQSKVVIKGENVKPDHIISLIF